MAYAKQTHLDTDELIRRFPDALDTTPSGKSSGPDGAWAVDDVYSGIDFRPPREVREAARKGLRLRRLNDERLSSSSSRGGGGIGVMRAVQLSEHEEITPRAAYRIRDYLTRHASDKKAKNFGNDEKPSPGYVAWLLWGGDPALPWAEDLIEQMESVAPKDVWKREPNPKIASFDTGKVFAAPAPPPRPSVKFPTLVVKGTDDRWGKKVEAYSDGEGEEARALVKDMGEIAASRFEDLARRMKSVVDANWPRDKTRRPRAVKKALLADPYMQEWMWRALGSPEEYQDPSLYNAAVTTLVNEVSLYARPREIQPLKMGGKRPAKRMWRLSDGQEGVRRAVVKARKAWWISQKNEYDIPPEVRHLLPANLIVRMDDEREQILVYDAFLNTKDTLERKILQQKAYAANHPQILKVLRSDIRYDDPDPRRTITPQDEYMALSATIMLLLEQTGLRPSDPSRMYYGAITLHPHHVVFFGEEVIIEFIGKAGTVNRVATRDKDLVRKLRMYKNRALQRGYSQIFTTSFGVPMNSTVVSNYLATRADAFRGLVPTTFRKLVAGRVAYQYLLDERDELYAEIAKLNEERADTLREGVLKAVTDAVQTAVAEAREALSHKDEKTTVASYINPEILLDFLNTGVLADTFEEATLKGATSVSFDPVRFLQAARDWQSGRRPNPISDLFRFNRSPRLGRLIRRVEGT